MAIYSAYIFITIEPETECYEGFRHTKLTGMYDKFEKGVGLYDDVYWMFAAHIVAILATVARNFFTSKTNGGNFARNILNGLKVWFYLLCLIGVMIADVQFDTRVSLAQIKEHNCPGLRFRLTSVDNYRMMELVVFYSMVGGLMGYIIISKLLTFLKLKYGSEEEIEEL